MNSVQSAVMIEEDTQKMDHVAVGSSFRLSDVDSFRAVRAIRCGVVQNVCVFVSMAYDAIATVDFAFDSDELQYDICHMAMHGNRFTDEVGLSGHLAVGVIAGVLYVTARFE